MDINFVAFTRTGVKPFETIEQIEQWKLVNSLFGDDRDEYIVIMSWERYQQCEAIPLPRYLLVNDHDYVF